MLEKRRFSVRSHHLNECSANSIVDRMQLDEVVSTVPTIGFNVETLKYKNLTFQVWDLGGQTSIRPFWRCYFPNTGRPRRFVVIRRCRYLCRGQCRYWSSEYCKGGAGCDFEGGVVFFPSWHCRKMNCRAPLFLYSQTSRISPVRWMVQRFRRLWAWQRSVIESGLSLSLLLPTERV